MRKCVFLTHRLANTTIHLLLKAPASHIRFTMTMLILISTTEYVTRLRKQKIAGIYSKRTSDWHVFQKSISTSWRHRIWHFHLQSTCQQLHSVVVIPALLNALSVVSIGLNQRLYEHNLIVYRFFVWGLCLWSIEA